MSGMVNRLSVSFGVWLLYALACVAPAIDARIGHNFNVIRGVSTPGIECLLVGWVPPYAVPWSANVLLLLGWSIFLCRRFTPACYFGFAAALAGLTTWPVLSYAFGSPQPGLLVGYCLWEGSLILFAWSAWFMHVRSRPQSQQDSTVLETGVR